MASIAGRLLVDAPARIPRPWSLLTAATPLTVSDGHVENGFTYQPGVCSPAKLWEVVCGQNDPETQNEAKDTDARSYGPIVGAEPFAVYAEFQCSSISGVTIGEAVERARANLAAGEAYAVERAFQRGEVGQTPSLQGSATDVTPASGALNPVGSMATLEAYLAENYLGLGVIHVPPAAVPYLCNAGLIERDGTGWRTCGLGTRVAIGAGYGGNIGPGGAAAADGEAWLYATGQVAYWRSEVFTNPDDESVFNRRDNTLLAVAERVYVIGFECVAVAIRMDLTCCC